MYKKIRLTIYIFLLSFFIVRVQAYAQENPNYIKTETSVKTGCTPILQFSIYPPLQFYPETTDVYGIRMSFLRGRNKDIYGLDLGLGLNEVTGNIEGVQIAGIMNNVGHVRGRSLPVNAGNLTGIQFGIGLNSIEGKLKGVQLAGILNASNGFTGIQLGAVNLFSMEGNGLQVGVINGTFSGADINGVQIGCIANLTSGDVVGGQIGGLFNIANNTKGIQVSPVLNFNKTTIFGAQLALANYTDDIRGGQFGVLNKSINIKGSQIGLVNITDTVVGFQLGVINYCNKMQGIQLGVINIIREGTIPYLPIANASFTF